MRLTLLRSQPTDLSAHAERGKLLDSFCAYQRSLNVEDDEDPEHWDMALLLSGLVNLHNFLLILLPVLQTTRDKFNKDRF